MRTRKLLATTAFLLLLPGCFILDRIRGDGDEGGSDDDAAEGEAAEGDAVPDESPEAGDGADADKPSFAVPTGLDRFKHWSPRHAFIGAPTIVADAISEQELIVATSDAHVGISRDGGETWSWTKADDAVRDVTGYPGGPYVALHEGALSLSDDGMIWRRLPRLSSDSLIDVVAADIGLVAIGKAGGYVHVGKDGSGGQGGWMPDKFKPKAITELNGAVLAWSGKTGYGTTDGSNWTELEQLPAMPDGKTYLTSAGSCSIAKVGKRRGVACKVSGNAHGVGDEFVVESKGVASLTRDGGESWVTSALPFKAANSIFGAAGGPYYAVGNGGAVAISKDGGQTWVDQKWEESANLADGLVDGNTVVIVGAKGTIIYSKDGGGKWDYAESPITKNLSWIGSSGGDMVASDGRAFISSSDGVTWVESEAIDLPGKAGGCTDQGPDDGEQCRYDANVTTPDTMPDVRSLVFRGDVGLALGDDALVAVSNDGGASWSTSHGLDLGRYGATRFHVRGDKVVLTDGAKLIVSADGGASWTEGQTVKTYRVNAVHISAGGLWLAAAKDELLAAKLDGGIWLPVADEPTKGDWLALFEIEGALFASGSKGQLLRSPDGEAWAEVLTGVSSPVIAMAGAGQEVWAVTAPTRKAGNVLLRSEDGGAHFIVVRELPSATDEPDLRVEDGAVLLADLVSRDQGETWRRETERYFPGLVDVADGSGMQITNLVYRYGSDRLYVVTGAGEHDWVRIDSAFNEGGAIQCDASTGCWMLASGVLYRPLGK